jgi:hypothetical protein
MHTFVSTLYKFTCMIFPVLSSFLDTLKNNSCKALNKSGLFRCSKFLKISLACEAIQDKNKKGQKEHSSQLAQPFTGVPRRRRNRNGFRILATKDTGSPRPSLSFVLGHATNGTETFTAHGRVGLLVPRPCVSPIYTRTCPPRRPQEPILVVVAAAASEAPHTKP